MKKILTVMVLLGVFVSLSFSVAMAAEEAKGLDPAVKQMVALAAGFGIAIAAFGGALGQGKGLAAALEGIARNPGAQGKIMTPMIIGMALIESLVIYSLVVSLLLFFKL
ncbi:MAG TPA: ATP synthase F0 subunit C [Syntrophorhabdaceae bacterium]|jgi:F-type H+-transporting ATPase subunit c|nr:ATP synthase subunit c [Syntrophorhabdaceae bacterium]MDI9560510.1 ATP synthase F0 subunit C [Pseudomonadota bacterium]OQC51740.1 MAG: ATP synthase subunit c [Deltaproteobacteria bacterium ADurb.Bin026]HNZ59730.1 ATP synthase F0 subunit C [Syntrophorhabdaceae bacterium]HOB70128.1 ATP synthase F0 subunit C [Syntrophorhabdaceae bacterium]